MKRLHLAFILMILLGITGIVYEVLWNWNNGHSIVFSGSILLIILGFYFLIIYALIFLDAPRM